MIETHPLMEWELATQQELFNYISIAQENKKSCVHAKSLVLEEGLSNLGIEMTEYNTYYPKLWLNYNA